MIIQPVFRPHGKESTEIRKSQIKKKKSENSYQELKRSQKGRHMETVSRYFDWHSHLSQSKESKCLFLGLTYDCTMSLPNVVACYFYRLLVTQIPHGAELALIS